MSREGSHSCERMPRLLTLGCIRVQRPLLRRAQLREARYLGRGLGATVGTREGEGRWPPRRFPGSGGKCTRGFVCL